MARALRDLFCAGRFVRLPHTGLMRCARCGGAVTARRKRHKHVYGQYAGFRSGSDPRAIREEKPEELLGEVVKAVGLDGAKVAWIL